jgi:hypothetical protein
VILGFGRDLKQEWGLESEAQLFFVLRWQELFAEDTYDSWQVRTSSIRTILDELLVGLDMAATVPTSYTSLGALLDEAAEIAANDEVIGEAFPFVRQALKDLRGAWESSRDEKARDLDRVRRETLVLRGCLSTYPTVLRAMLIQDLAAPPNPYKCRLYGLAMSLAVELSAQGYSTPHLREALSWLTTPGQPFAERLNAFLTRLGGRHHLYQCYLPVRLSLTDVPRDPFPDVSFIRGREMSQEAASVKDFAAKAGASLLCRVQVEAPDPIAARHAARAKAEEAFAAIRLYHLQGDATFAGTLVLVVPRDGGEATGTDEDQSRLGYMRSPKDSSRKLARLAQAMQHLSEADRSRLNAVLQYHRLALAAGTDETRLANLWVALECLVRLPKTSVIENVCRYIPATVATHHVQGVVRNVAIDLREGWRSETTEAGTLRTSAGQTGFPKDLPLPTLLRWLTQDDSKPEIRAIYQLATANPLMVFRLDRVQKHYIKDRAVLAGMLKRHGQHIDWQLRRVYRARNRIVHWGASPAQVRHLCQHLHAYLVLTLMNLMQDLALHDGWGIAEALEFRRTVFTRISDAEAMLGKALTPEAVLSPALLFQHQRTDAKGLWSGPDVSVAVEDAREKGGATSVTEGGPSSP